MCIRDRYVMVAGWDPYGQALLPDERACRVYFVLYGRLDISSYNDNRYDLKDLLLQITSCSDV